MKGGGKGLRFAQAVTRAAEAARWVKDFASLRLFCFSPNLGVACLCERSDYAASGAQEVGGAWPPVPLLRRPTGHTEVWPVGLPYWWNRGPARICILSVRPIGSTSASVTHRPATRNYLVAWGRACAVRAWEGATLRGLLTGSGPPCSHTPLRCRDLPPPVGPRGAVGGGFPAVAAGSRPNRFTWQDQSSAARLSPFGLHARWVSRGRSFGWACSAWTWTQTAGSRAGPMPPRVARGAERTRGLLPCYPGGRSTGARTRHSWQAGREREQELRRAPS